MGFFKKIFKPVSKVLDKIIPNEIKPALPYLAAFAPVFGPTAGMFGSTMGKRMLLSGGANILGQLSQEGNEGDINLLSAGLGALTGAMTTPGAAETFRGAQLGTPGATGADAGFYVSRGLDVPASQVTGLQKVANFGLEGLARGSEILRPDGAIPNLFSKAGAKAAVLPATTATGDVMQAEARQLEKQQAIDDALAAAELIEDSGARAQAIRNAMLSYGFFTDEEIDSTISSAGYADGGTVGIMSMKRGLVDGPGGYSGEYITKKSKNWITKKEKFDLADLESLQDDEEDEDEDNDGIEWIKKKDSSDSFKWIQKKAEGGIMNAKRGFVDGPGGYAGEMAGPLRNKIEGFGKKMVDEFLKGNLPEFKGELVSDRYNRPNFTDVSAVLKIIEMGGDFDDVRNVLKIDISDERIKDFIRFDQEDKARKEGSMKDGGLMNLGGKEMDLRGGGFVPIGKKERADDVPARLSKNEFVMTADAVRAAGGGSVNKGAKRMYEVMNKLEARA